MTVSGIPIENIYFLLCYAWNRLEEKEQVPVDTAKSTDILDLLARVLDGGLSHLIRRGYDRGYITHEEDTQVLRGRLLSTETMNRNLRRSARVRCAHDELSYDVLHNRILKATLLRLLRARGLDGEIVSNLVDHRHRMHTVRDIELSDNVFTRVVLHRNNFFYDFLLRIARLIFHNLLPSEEEGEYRFRDFVTDEHRMRLLFEEFIRSFYAHELEGWKVKRDAVPWQLFSDRKESLAVLPRMETDVSLIHDRRRVIIECKFTARHFQQRDEQYKKTFRSGHMYQLNAYLQNMHDAAPDRDIEGVLLYPTVGEHLRHSFTNPRGQRLRIWSVDLNQPWQAVHAELVGMVGGRHAAGPYPGTLLENSSSHNAELSQQIASAAASSHGNPMKKRDREG